MFALTCPSCQHTVRTRFARLGATATCPSCKAQFKVDNDTLKLEADVEGETESAAVSEAPQMSSQPVEELRVQRPPLKKPDPPAEPPPAKEPAPVEPPAAASEPAAAPVEANDSAAALAAAAAAEAPAPPRPAAGKGRPTRKPAAKAASKAAASTRPTHRRRKRGVDMKLVVVMAVLLILAVIVVVLFIQRMTHSSPTYVSNVPPPKTSTNTGANTDTNNPPPSHPAPKMLPDTPVLKLAEPVLANAAWTRLHTPADPITPSMSSDVVLWNTMLQRFAGKGDKAIINGLYVADTSQVYRRGVLHVQLLDDSGLVYAERQMFVPVVCSRAGLSLHVPVPSDLLSRSKGVKCEFTPVDPVVGGEALEMVESDSKLVGEAGAPVLKLTVRNPHEQALSGLSLVVDVLTTDGWPLGEWQGTLDQTIGAGQTLTFQTAPPITDGASIGRVIVRGYGKRS